MNDSPLPSRCLAVRLALINEVHAWIIENAPRIKAAVLGFQGKAYLCNGSKSNKFQKVIASLNLPNTGNFRTILMHEFSTLYLKIYASKNVENIYESYSYTLFLGDVPAQEIVPGKSDSDFSSLPTNMTVEKLMEAQKQIATLQAQISKIEKDNYLHFYN